MNETLHQALSRAASNLNDCLDSWVDIEGTIGRMERDNKHWPNAAKMKKELEKGR